MRLRRLVCARNASSIGGHLDRRLGNISSRSRIAPFACMAALMSITVVALPSHADVIEAVWKAQQINFTYQAGSTFYTCEGLHNKLRAILKRVGARDTLVIRLRGSCGDMSTSVPVQITLESPVEATAENLRELTSYTGRDELLGKIRGEVPATEHDLPRFPATFQTVSFARDRSLKLAEGDCELVQQVRREVLQQLSVRVLYDGLGCSPFGNPGRPQLTVSALVAVTR